MLLMQLVKQAINSTPSFTGIAAVVEKEILHHELLYVLHKEGLLKELTFIGGTSLRLCYKSSRLSEDLDFSASSDFSPSHLKGLSEAISDHLANKYALKVAVHEPRLAKGDTSTWKVTIEKAANRPDIPSQKIHLDICSIASIERVFRPALNFYNINSPIEGLPLPVQTTEEILADKMVAFAFRQRRIKPRDVWDIVWLKQQSTEQNTALIEKKLSLRNKTVDDYVRLTAKHAQMLTADPDTKLDFEQEMTRFVPSDVASRTLLNDNFWGYLGKSIQDDVTAINRKLTDNAPENDFRM